MKIRSTGRALRLFVLAACTAAMLPGMATAQQLGGGVKAGVALGDIPEASAALEGETGVDMKQRIGFAAGGFLTLRFPSGFAIQPEFLYTQKGVRFTAAGETAATMKIDFLDVPVLARYTFGKGVRGYVFAGPSFDFKMSAKVKFAPHLGLGGDEEDMGDDVKSFETAIVFGGGVELGPILLEARWSEGLTSLDKQPASGDPKIKTRTILVLAGIRF